MHQGTFKHLAARVLIIVTVVGMVFNPFVACEAAFIEVGDTAGLGGVFDNLQVAWGDYDGDGDLDLAVAERTHGLLYRNNGNGTFSQVASMAGIIGSRSSRGLGWSDYDNDGDLDLYVSNGGNEQDFLFQNNNGIFTQVAQGVGMADNSDGWGPAWADYDADHDLDVFVSVPSNQQDFLYRNGGSGTFQQVAPVVGMAEASNTTGAVWGDYDGDGDLDLFVANNGQPSFLYQNNGDGTFTDTAANAGITLSAPSNASGALDYDADGDPDIYVAGTGQDLLYRNNGNGTFTEAGVSANIGGDASNGLSAAAGDYDNDGDLDVYVTNAGSQDFLYRNNGDGTFTNVATAEGMTSTTNLGLGAAWADYDRDGDLDIFVSNNGEESFLYQNQVSGLNWIKILALTDRNGNAVESDAEPDRLAIASKVEVDLDGGADFAVGAGRYVAMLVAPSDGLSQTAGEIHLGAGTASTVDVRVTFPDGDKAVVSGVAVNQTITVKDPGAAPPADVTAPTITNVTATPNSLWPPNHKMVNVAVNATVTDNSDPSPTFKITAVTSNEPENGLGDGDASADSVITGDHAAQLRAERSGTGNGRVYTITIQARDASGNVSAATVTVTVPKSQKN